MQAVLQFFDMPLKAMGTDGPQKIAIKMPTQKSRMDAGDESGFMAVMDALMALSPEQLQTSLEGMDWVPIAEGAETLVPLIDLSDMDRSAMDWSQFFIPGDAKLMSPLIPGQEKNPNRVNIDGLVQTKWIPSQSFSQMTRSDRSVGDAKATGEGNVEFHVSEKAQNAFVLHDAVTPLPQENDGVFLNKTGHADAVAASSAAASVKKELATDFMPKDAAMVKEQMVAAKGKEERGLETHRKTGVVAKAVAHLHPDADSVSAKRDEPAPFAEDRSRVGMETKTAKERMLIFKGQPDPVPTPADQLVNAVRQAKTAPAKEMVRQQVHRNTVQVDLDHIADGVLKVRQNSSAKETSLSFTSRWAGLVEHGEENMTEAKASESAQPKTDAHDVIRQMVQRMTLKSSRLQTRMNIKLKPEFLGNVRMQISTVNQQVAVRMMADSKVVKEMLEQNIQFLKSELLQHGLEIDKFDVFVGGENDEWRQKQQAHWQRRSRQGDPETSREMEDGKLDMDENSTSARTLRAPALKGDGEIDYFA